MRVIYKILYLKINFRVSLNYFPSVCLPYPRAHHKKIIRREAAKFFLTYFVSEPQWGSEPKYDRPAKPADLKIGGFCLVVFLWHRDRVFCVIFGVIFSLIPPCFRDFVVWDRVFWVFGPSWTLLDPWFRDFWSCSFCCHFLGVCGIIFGVSFVVVF